MTTATIALDTQVAAMLEHLANEHAVSARAARMAGEKEDAKFFQRSANAFARALRYWLDGIRPEQTPAGNWLLPSQRGAAEPPHLLRKDGDWVCTCSSGDFIHWASAMIIGIEAASDEADTDDADPLLSRLHSAMDGAARSIGYDEALAAIDELYA